MRLMVPPRRPLRRVTKLRRYVRASIVLTILFWLKDWLCCVFIIVYCYISWNIAKVNYIGSGNDGFPLHLESLPPAPDIDFAALASARALLASSPHNTSSDEYSRAQDFVTKSEELLRWGPESEESDRPIPPIMHHIAIEMKTPIPQKWLDARDACKQVHPDWTFMFWDDASAEDFVRKEHPWFLHTWTNYKYPIQRADSLRYLVLFTYGGTYLDMDLQCRRSLDPFRKFKFVAPAAHPVGISNGFIMTAPKNSFLRQLTSNLQYFNRWYLSPYITVMISAGCMYVSSQHAIASDRSELMVLGGLNNKLSGNVTTPIFSHLGASSWHEKDAKVFKVLGKVLKSIPIFGKDY
ncbi:hypothetical protein SpCBS45565_g07116 [Spizellomyces sp. 'palustris']|nr:hypothetical protein SpCBS45565_g07116 [Spizellomyces sp. 'palustris']